MDSKIKSTADYKNMSTKETMNFLKMVSSVPNKNLLLG